MSDDTLLNFVEGIGDNPTMEQLEALVAKHDELIESKPESVEHNTDAMPCPICALKEGKNHNDDTKGGDMSETFTKDELDSAVASAVAAAVAPLQSELNDIKSSAETAEVEARIQAVHDDAKVYLDAVLAQLDTTTAERDTATTELAELKSDLEATATAWEEAAQASEREVARLEAIAKVASFDDSYIDAQKGRWIAMSDEDFDALLETLTASGAKPAEAKDDEKGGLSSSAMKASENAPKASDARKSVMRMALMGNDPSTIARV